MGTVAIVSDASIDLPQGVAAELGITLAPLGYELNGRRFLAGEQPPAEFYAGLDDDGRAIVEGVSADDFEVALREAAQHAPAVLCLCQSVGSSFTRVSAEVAIRRVQKDIDVRLISPGRSTAGLGAICMAAAGAARDGKSADAVFALVEELSLAADTYAIPGSLDLLERSGDLELFNSQSNVGPIDAGIPVFRVRGRVSPVAVAPDHPAAEAALLERIASAAGDREVIAIAVHAEAPEAAQRLADDVRGRLNVSELHIGPMGPTIGSVLGPGAYGLGFCALPPG